MQFSTPLPAYLLKDTYVNDTHILGGGGGGGFNGGKEKEIFNLLIKLRWKKI